jgi:hypothetical protein
MCQIPHRILRQHGIDVGDLRSDFSVHGCCRGVQCEDGALSHGGQYPHSTVALAKSAKGQGHVSRNRPAIVVGIVAATWASLLTIGVVTAGRI